MNQEKIGKFIANLRKKKKLTQEELAEKLGVNSRTVSRWENGINMPDLSLFPLLSKELDISINELISGEVIKQDAYQEKFEENVVNVVSRVDKSNKISNIIFNSLLSFIVLFIFLFVGRLFYVNYEFIQKYDSKNMYIEKLNDNNLIFKVSSFGKFKYLLTTYEDNEGLIFVSFKKTLDDYNIDKRNFDSNSGIIDLTSNYIGHAILINDSFEKYKIYYTKTNFSKIAKASNEELKEIIKNSNLMYEKY